MKDRLQPSLPPHVVPGAMRLHLILVSTLGMVACGGTSAGSDDIGSSESTSSGGSATDGSSTSEGTLDAGTTSDPTASTGSEPPPDSVSSSGDTSVQGSEGGERTTGQQPDGQWSITHITYSGPSGTQMVELDDCAFCDATLNGPTLLVRYQQAEGWTVWSVDIPIDANVGAQPITADYSGAYVAINEQNPDLPTGYTGFYAPTTGSGTLVLTQADIDSGGVVAGTLEAHLSLGDVTAYVEAEFYAEIP